MSDLATYNFDGATVRVVRDAAGEPWFVAADVLAALELDRKAMERLEDDERGVSSIHTLGGEQSMTTLNEPGLYSLILGSRKPEAKAFKRWVTHEVLPAIRKTGGYGAPAVPQTLPEALRLAADLAEQKAKAEAMLAIAAPKAEALDRLAAGDEAVTMTQAAKLLGVKRERLTNWMNANGWIYRQNGSWVAYQQHIENGRMQYKEAKYTDLNTGQDCHRPYCHIMPKGLAKLAEAMGCKLPAAA